MKNENKTNKVKRQGFGSSILKPLMTGVLTSVVIMTSLVVVDATLFKEKYESINSANHYLDEPNRDIVYAAYLDSKEVQQVLPLVKHRMLLPNSLYHGGYDPYEILLIDHEQNNSLKEKNDNFEIYHNLRIMEMISDTKTCSINKEYEFNLLESPTGKTDDLKEWKETLVSEAVDLCKTGTWYYK